MGGCLENVNGGDQPLSLMPDSALLQNCYDYPFSPPLWRSWSTIKICLRSEEKKERKGEGKNTIAKRNKVDGDFFFFLLWTSYALSFSKKHMM